MILQFCNVSLLDLDVAKLSAYLLEADAGAIVEDIVELSRRSGVSEDALKSNVAVKRLLASWKTPSSTKRFRTPLSDWHEIPFLLDDNEQPVTAANAWLRHISKRGSPKTWRTYEYALFDFFQYLEANEITWQNADDDTLFSYRLYQETTDSIHKKKQNGTRKVSRGTIQARILIAGRFYQYATLHGYIKTNPITFTKIEYRRPIQSDFLGHLGGIREKELPIAAYTQVPKTKTVRALPHETVWTWISSIENERDRLIAKLLYQTGMRREEIILWQLSDIPKVNLKNNDSTQGWTEFEIRGKGGKNRLIRISDSLFLRLREWIDLVRPKILAKAGIRTEEDHGFVWIAQTDGHPLQPVTLNHIFDKISERSEINITPHMLRHSFSKEKRTELYEDGIPNPEKVLQVLLGHSSVVTTMSIYGHISPQEESREAESNAELLLKLTPHG